MERNNDNRPRSREQHNVSGGGNIKRRGQGLGTGPVGTGSAPSHNVSYNASGSSKGVKRAGGGIGFAAILFIGYMLFSKLTGGSGEGTLPGTTNSGSLSQGIMQTLTQSFDYTTTESDYSSVDGAKASQGKLNRNVSKLARDRYTNILENGKDTVTVMVYLCGTDLESKHGMATSDLSEMCKAKLSDKVNVIVYTGGCKEWKNDIVSNSKNQIYQVKDGGLVLLEKDMGNSSMTKPSNLADFIKYCTKNFPANRQELILWDHGSGSINGYGYDEKNASSGSMTLAGINEALKSANTKFDFIGFDACLMATVENAIMLTQYADYMIASEETEPGIGWYYTNWLTKLSENTSIDTIDLGKIIVDDFVDVCGKKCVGQKTTLSLTDLAELEMTVPDELKTFAKSTNELIKNNEYKAVSDARSNTKEFAQSSKIDQIDFVHFAKNLNTSEGKKLASVLTEAVKYNRTASCVSNAYGLSIYFPYQKASKVDQVVNTYENIGMDSEYARVIQEFASLEVSGQISQGGNNTAMPSLTGTGLDSLGSLGGNFDSILSMLGSISGAGTSSASSLVGAEGVSSLLMSFLSNKSMSDRDLAQYIADNSFDASQLVFTNVDGNKVISLSEEQWALINTVDLNVFYDDGTGYVDLGLDNLYSFDKYGNLIGDYDRTWLSINGQIVAYHHTDTVEAGDEYTISGYVPAYLNGERVELQLIFDNANPYGYITGAKPVYENGETETVAKSVLGLKKGDELDFLCDYFTYDGKYSDTYMLGEKMILGDEIVIGNADIGEGNVKVTYRFTDIYNQHYWSEELK